MKELKDRNIPYKIYLTEDEMPKYWYNVRADMTNKPAPLLNPGTLKPMTAEELGGVFCAELVKQEMDDTTAYFEIPEDIRNFYKMYRPSPLVRAYCLEEKLQTPAKIYYKFEGNNTSGSHKLWAKWQERAGNRRWFPCRPRPYMCMWRCISVFLWKITRNAAVPWRTRSWC